MYFPSAEDQEKRLTAEEIFNLLYLRERQTHLLEGIETGIIPAGILSQISHLLKLSDSSSLQDQWLYKPFTLSGFKAESSQRKF